jgi:DNA-binding transcriptional MerR regulator
VSGARERAVRIGDLAARTGASARSIRYYEEQGLLGSVRTASGQRTYPESAVDRVLLIRRLFDAGISSRTMYNLLPCMTDPSIRTPWLTDRLRDERERIVAEIAQLGQTVAALDAVIGDLDVSAPGQEPAGVGGGR